MVHKAKAPNKASPMHRDNALDPERASGAGWWESPRFHLCLPKGIGTMCGKVQAVFWIQGWFRQSGVLSSHPLACIP